jgi:hypothetical protein
MDAKAKYKLADKALSRRAAMLSKLDDASEQRREIGIVAAGLEEAVNQKNWGMVERMTVCLLKLRESQDRAKRGAEEVVDLAKFNLILNGVLDCVCNRIKQFLPDDYPDVIDLIEADLKQVHYRLHPTRQIEDQR